MTPEEIAKLAMECAWAAYHASEMRSENVEHAAVEIAPILTAHLAAREEEYARLRKIATRTRERKNFWYQQTQKHYEWLCKLEQECMDNASQLSTLRAENERLREALQQISRIVQPYDDAIGHVCASIAVKALTPQQEPGK